MSKRQNPEPSALQKTINELHAELETVNGDSEEYSRMADQLTKLYKIQNENERSKDKFSKDTLVLAATNLIGIATIVSYEHSHVISSKALSFVFKPR